MDSNSQVIRSNVINHDWIQCNDCGWIGKTEDGVLPEMGSIVSCPSCSCLDVQAYHGPTSIEIPVNLLSDVLSKLCVASFMIGNEQFRGDYAEAHRLCTQSVSEQLFEFMIEKGLIPKDKSTSPKR